MTGGVGDREGTRGGEARGEEYVGGDLVTEFATMLASERPGLMEWRFSRREVGLSGTCKPAGPLFNPSTESAFEGALPPKSTFRGRTPSSKLFLLSLSEVPACKAEASSVDSEGASA
jgi:hypothetical protein